MSTSRTHSLAVLPWLLAAASVLALSATFAACESPEALEQRADDGALCADCHDTGHAHGGHAGLSCGGCHVVDHALADQLSWSSTGLASLPDHSEITACGMCHEDRPRTALATEGHRSHAHVEGDCAACHDTVHRGEEATACASCHAGVERHGATADERCDRCHTFRPEGTDAMGTLDRARLAGFVSDAGAMGTGPMGALPALGPGGEGAHGRPPITSAVHGGVDCRRCHDPHQSEEAPVDCQSCHRGYLAEQVRSSAHDACSDCHEAHGERAHPAVDCLRCHTYPREGHGWSVARPGTVSDQVAAANRAETAGRITHGGNCASCHDPHTSVASEERCASCHAEQRAALDTLPPAARAEGSHERCTTCHQPHEPAPTAAVCTSCHTDVHAQSANVREHRDCLSCHEPHHPRPEPRAACASCHTTAHTQTATSAAAHRDCTSCHQQHGAPLAPTPTACAHCHEAPARSLATSQGVPSEHRCASCHAPHTFGGDDQARARCASCHRETVSLHASHRGTCTTCHEAHATPIGASTDCAGCHEDVHPRAPGHAECAGCHAPHTAAVEALGRCERCHAAEASSTSRWPRASPHAGECSACHRPHDEHATPAERGGSRATLCQSCHVAESARSHTGPHEQCTGCHSPHATGSGPVASTWWSSCAGCHAAEAQAAQASSGTHARCAACHQSPGPPLPRCASCHQPSSLRLSHGPHLAQPGVTCTSCHESHGSAPPQPSQCLACHTRQRDEGHFSDAPSCSSCHPFR